MFIRNSYDFTEFLTYRKELDKIAGWDTSLEEITQEYESLCRKRHIWWLPLTDHGKDIGFIVVGTHPECHAQADYFIINAYIKPAYRRKHLMTRYVRKFVESHPGIYCLDIINKNVAAKAFWRKTFRSMGYKPYQLPEIPGRLSGDCTAYGWRKWNGKS